MSFISSTKNKQSKFSQTQQIKYKLYIHGAGVVSIDDSDRGAEGGGRVGVNAVSLVVRPRAPAKFLKYMYKQNIK